VHRFITGLQYRRAAVVVALWPAAAISISRLFGVPASRLRVVPNARDPATFRPPTAEERRRARLALDLADDQPVACFVGSLAPEKRIDLAIDAIALTQRHQLLVVGDGPLRSNAEAQGRELAPHRVRFLGALPDVRPILHAADVVLITSDIEGMPGIAIEAAMTGLPVVATDAGALREMPGVQIVEREAAAIANALRAAAPPTADVDLNELSWPTVADRWSAVFSALAGEGFRHPRAGRRSTRRLSESRVRQCLAVSKAISRSETRRT
jgi:glycosyltransferase involved in cell wall biosynthesis